MADSEADIGHGTIIEVRSGDATSDGYVALGEVTDLTPPSDTIDEIDVTHMQSPERRKEFIPGLSDAGSMSLTMNFYPGGTTDEFILTWKASGERRQTRITYPSGRTQVITTFVKTYSQTIPNGDKMSATLELRCTGASVFA